MESTSTEASGEAGKYIDCIIKSAEPRDFGPIGVGEVGGRVYTVHYGDIAAVVSDTPIKIYDPTRENVLAHEFVNETAMCDFTVIPMSFGTIFRTQDDIVELLKSTYRVFYDVLEKMQDEIEFGLTVLWDRDEVISRLEEEDVDEMASGYATDILDALKPVAIASRSSTLIGDRMVLNAAFLVERVGEEAFDAAVGALSRKYEDLLTFRYTGPWPPYNFVNIKLKLERAEG